jgi:hypothetical protein
MRFIPTLQYSNTPQMRHKSFQEHASPKFWIRPLPSITHRLTYLAEKIGLELSPERQELLEIITDFNLEARYPDEKFSFHKKCTKKFTETSLEKIEEIKEWLLEHI